MTTLKRLEAELQDAYETKEIIKVFAKAIEILAYANDVENELLNIQLWGTNSFNE